MVPSVSMMKCAHVPGSSPLCLELAANVYRRRIHLDRLGRDEVCRRCDLVAAAPNPGAAQHPSARCSTRSPVGRASRAAARTCCGIDRPPPLGSCWATGPALARPQVRRREGPVVRRDESRCGWCPRSPCRCSPAPTPSRPRWPPRRAATRHGPPVVDDLVPHHPVLVGGVHRQQVDPACVDHSRTIGRQQTLFGIARVGQPGRSRRAGS